MANRGVAMLRWRLICSLMTLVTCVVWMGGVSLSGVGGDVLHGSRKLLFFTGSGVTPPIRAKKPPPTPAAAVRSPRLTGGFTPRKARPVDRDNLGLDQDTADWLGHDCDKILLDLGANRGDTIERWFGYGQWMGGNQMWKGKVDLGDVRSHFQTRNRHKFCMLSFEANPEFTERLERLEAAYQAKGFKLKVMTETAVSSEDGPVELHIDHTSATAYGSSLYGDKVVSVAKDTIKNGKTKAKRVYEKLAGPTMEVRGLRLAGVLEAVPQEDKPLVIVKMDVEGGEYKILPALIKSGQICKIDILIIEWHSHKLMSIPEYLRNLRRLDDGLEWLLEQPPCAVTIINDD